MGKRLIYSGHGSSCRWHRLVAQSRVEREGRARPGYVAASQRPHPSSDPGASLIRRYSAVGAGFRRVRTRPAIGSCLGRQFLSTRDSAGFMQAWRIEARRALAATEPTELATTQGD
jgi:hypothetical protein